MTDTERLAAIKKLCADFSPSAIPDLRGRARHDREAHPEWGKHPVYAVDHVCDLIEAIFKIVGAGGMMPADLDWSVYDELRNYGQDAGAEVTGGDRDG